MKIRILVVLLIACFALVKQASAQSDFYTADSYYSVTIAGDGTVYTSVTVEGQVNWDAPGGAEHTYTNYSTLNGSPMYQESDPTRDYVSLTNCQQASYNPGQEVAFSYEESVDCNYMGEVYDCEEDYQFPVVFITMSFSGPPSSNDPNAINYSSLFPGEPLGGFANNILTRSCVVGYEAQGSVTPPDYGGSISMERTIMDQALFINQMPAGGAAPGPDNSGGNWTTSSAPTLWDLDATGWISQLPQSPNVYRYRSFFVEQAFLEDEGVPVSPPQPFFAAIACTNPSGEYMLSTDVQGDNRGGLGSIPLTWNLQ